ncbi:Bromo adjacent (BAH) domain [Trinorchestia longiramus]|nr:Bromo adjacent (BAH) domain [Trinorchestia longiramus]
MRVLLCTDYQPVTGPIPTGAGSPSFKTSSPAAGSSGCPSSGPFSSPAFSSPPYSSPSFSAPIYSTPSVSPPYTSPPYASPNSSSALRGSLPKSRPSSSPLPSYPAAESYSPSSPYNYPSYQGYPPYGSNKQYRSPSYSSCGEGYSQSRSYAPYPPQQHQYDGYSFSSNSPLPAKSNPLALPPPPAPPSGTSTMSPTGAGAPTSSYPPQFPDFGGPPERIGVPGNCCDTRVEVGMSSHSGSPLPQRHFPPQQDQHAPSEFPKGQRQSMSKAPVGKLLSKVVPAEQDRLKLASNLPCKKAEVIDLESLSSNASSLPSSCCRQQQQSPDSSGRTAHSSSPGSRRANLASCPKEDVQSSSCASASTDNQRLAKNKSDGLAESLMATSSMASDISAANSTIAATLANILKLNSCTIRNANVLPPSPSSQGDSSPASQVSSGSQSPVPVKTSSSGSRTPVRVSPQLRASPQVPSINSTTNVPLQSDSKDRSASAISPLRGSSPSNRNKRSPPNSENLSIQRLKTVTEAQNSQMGLSCNGTALPSSRGNLKNSEEIRRSIASALPHLSASMVMKEMDSSSSLRSDLSTEVETVGRKPLSSEDILGVRKGSSPHSMANIDSKPFSSLTTRESSSPCLPFPSDDATDLSVANDLLLLSQSDLQFPSNSTSFLPTSCAVSVTSTSTVDQDDLGSSSADRPPSRPPSSKALHSSCASVDRSNSNSPNPRFGSRHLLCQMVPAHSQTKTATARAKPLSVASNQRKVATVKTEVKDSVADFMISGSVADVGCKRKDLPVGNDIINKSNLIPTKQDSTSSSSSPVRKRGRPPKIKDKPVSEIEGVVSLKTSMLSNNVRCDSKNVRAHGEPSGPQCALVHQYKIKITEEKLPSSKKLASSKSDSKDSKLEIKNSLNLKKSLEVKTESVPKIKSEKVSPSVNYSPESQSKLSSTNYKLVNGDHDPANHFFHGNVDRLMDVLGVEKLTCAQSQIPSSCEQLNFVLSSHTKFKPGVVKKSSSEDSKASKLSDSSSSREGSNPSPRNAKVSKQSSKSSGGKQSKTGKVARKSETKSRCKKSLLAYLKEKNDNDSANVDSDVPSSSEAGGACSTSGATDAAKGSGGAKTAGPGAFSSFPSKGIRRRSSSGAGKSKALKKPKYSHGWSWEGQPYQGKIWLRNDEVLMPRTCYAAMRHKEGDVVRVRDCVLLRSGPRRADLPFVAKVAALWEEPETGDMMMSILWYYRPEHTDLGRQEHDLSDEIFASKHRDHLSVACIEDTCYVLTFNEYCRYRRHLRLSVQGLSAHEIVSVVPDPEFDYPRQQRQPPGCVVSDLLFFCRKVYDYRQKRILKNPSLLKSSLDLLCTLPASDASSLVAASDASSRVAASDASSRVAASDASSRVAASDASSRVAASDASSRVAASDASSRVTASDASSRVAASDASSRVAASDASSRVACVLTMSTDLPSCSGSP